MDMDFRIFEYNQTVWSGCTELQILENNLTMRKMCPCYHKNHLSRVGRKGCLFAPPSADAGSPYALSGFQNFKAIHAHMTVW